MTATVDVDGVWSYTLDTDDLGYCEATVLSFGDRAWSGRYHRTTNAEAAAQAFIEAMKLAYQTGYPGAANYVLGAGQWPGAQANVSNDSPVLCKQRPGEWFTTWLVRLAANTARAIGDREGIAKWEAEYEKCSEGAKGL
jgi:hypothetical protein